MQQNNVGDEIIICIPWAEFKSMMWKAMKNHQIITMLEHGVVVVYDSIPFPSFRLDGLRFVRSIQPFHCGWKQVFSAFFHLIFDIQEVDSTRKEG